jgi:hypothetical protein
MQVVGCPLADAVVARIDSIRKRVAIFFSEATSGASTCNGGPPGIRDQGSGIRDQGSGNRDQGTGQKNKKVYQ